MAERKFAALAALRRPPEPPADEIPTSNRADAQVTLQASPVEAPRPSPPPELPPPSPSVPAPVAASPPVPAPTPAAAPVPTAIASETPKGRGRPPGKRSDPDWAPRTILMRSQTHRRVSIMLLEKDRSPDLSELVDELLQEWISKQT